MKNLLTTLLLLAAACSKDPCPIGETDCGGQCVSLISDPANCGACGVQVGPLELCAAGTATCRAGIGTCAGACIDFARDPDNCGGCGVSCGAHEFCSTDSTGTSCTTACPTGYACGRSCVDFQTDPYHCGACGNACAAGQSCRRGSCAADLQVACYATDELVPVAADLSSFGSARLVPSGPTSIAVHDAVIYSANGYPQASLSAVPVDPLLPAHDLAVTGDDLEHVAVEENVVLVSNASVGSLLFLSPAGDLLGEVAMPDNQHLPNPHGFAVTGGAAYVALYGSGSGAGQSIVKVGLSLAECAASPLVAPCGSVVSETRLLEVAAAFDPPGRPFPSGVATAGGKVYVTLANLKEADFVTYTAWAEPAGHGKLAVIDTGKGDALSVVDLGAGCGNPGTAVVDGSTLWIACGSWSFPDLAPGVLLPVDVSQHPPVVGAPIGLGAVIPGGLAFCGGVGYATDQSSGAVVRFDPIARTVEAPVTVCSMGPWGFAWASDVACGQ